MPDKYHLINRKQRVLPGFLVIAALSLSAMAKAAESSPFISDSSRLSSGADFLLDDAPQFLPVEQAYVLHPGMNGEQLIIDWDIAPGYYLYKHRFDVTPVVASDSGAALASPLVLSFQPGTFIYDDYYGKDLEVFYKATQIVASLADNSPANGRQAERIFIITSQGCADAGLCYPPRKQTIRVNTADGIAEVIDTPPVALTGVDSNNNGIAADLSASNLTATTSPANDINLALMLLFALAGGIILNLMPCVFPVLSIKVMATTSAHLGVHNKHLHSLAYSAGIILSFLAIAVVMLVLKSSGQAIGWGFQLQSPIFVALLAYLLFIIAQSFSGQLTLGGNWMNMGQRFTESSTVTGSFMTGVLATVVASPCTAPFMGTALGVALTQTPVISLSIFAALGLGMALPFLALSWIPGLMEKLPAPGPWMNTFSQLLAFPLYASVIWLLWVLGRQTTIDHAIMVSLGILLLAFAIWLHQHTSNIPAKVFLVLVLVGAVSLTTMSTSTDQETLWEPYSPERLSQLRSENQAVFINLTADWCITCLANEKIALDSDAFRSVLKTRQITYLKGDWTNNNPEITRLLNQHNRNGVPLYLYFDAEGSPVKILPQLLSKNLVLKTFGVN